MWSDTKTPWEDLAREVSGYVDSKSVTSVGRDTCGKEPEDKIGTAGVSKGVGLIKRNGIVVCGVKNKGIKRSETG